MSAAAGRRRLSGLSELRCARSSGGGAYSSAALRHTTTNIYFPKTDAVTFEQANTSQIFGEWVELRCSPTSCPSDRSVCSSPAKLKELNEGTPPEHRLTEESLDTLEGLLEAVCDPCKPPPTLQQMSLLWKAVHWPEGTTPLTGQVQLSRFHNPPPETPET